MGNRWVEFVKNYSKDNNMSYTCAMCDIKTKGLYTPSKKQNKPLKTQKEFNTPKINEIGKPYTEYDELFDDYLKRKLVINKPKQNETFKEYINRLESMPDIDDEDDVMGLSKRDLLLYLKDEKYKYNFYNAYCQLEQVRKILNENKNYIKPSKEKLYLYKNINSYFPHLDETEEFRKK